MPDQAQDTDPALGETVHFDAIAEIAKQQAQTAEIEADTDPDDESGSGAALDLFGNNDSSTPPIDIGVGEWYAGTAFNRRYWLQVVAYSDDGEDATIVFRVLVGDDLPTSEFPTDMASLPSRTGAKDSVPGSYNVERLEAEILKITLKAFWDHVTGSSISDDPRVEWDGAFARRVTFDA